MHACFTLVSELPFFMRVEVFKTDFEKIVKYAEKRETCKKISLPKERLLCKTLAWKGTVKLSVEISGGVCSQETEA